MRSVTEVLQDKEARLQKLAGEIEALRVAAKIVTEANGDSTTTPTSTNIGGNDKKRWP